MTTDTRVAIIGGGIMGASLAWHLTARGWRDVVLLEKAELTAGSTWHAAGLCTHFAHNATVMEMRAASVRLYRDILPAETGESAGFHACGALRVTRSAERMAEFRHVQGLGEFLGHELRILAPEELALIYPLARMDGLLGAIHEPDDGHVDPTLATNALAAGARSRGAEIRRHEPVRAIERDASGAWVVHTDRGRVRSPHVVNAAGTWCREIGAMMGVDLPVVPMLHQYLVTAAVPEIAARIAAGEPELPMIRDPEESWYVRQERDGFIVGPYEAEGRPWGVDGIPPEFGMELLPPDLDRIEPIVAMAMERVPALAQAGIRTIVHGPITFTPDANPLVGPAFGLDNAWLLTGSSMGVMEGGGAGRFLADWMVDGAPPMDALAVDPRRFGAWADRDYRVAKATECFGLQFGGHYPFEERPAGRPRRVTPIHDAQAARGAVFGCAYGWERPNWFASGRAPRSEVLPESGDGVRIGAGPGSGPERHREPLDKGACRSPSGRDRRTSHRARAGRAPRSRERSPAGRTERPARSAAHLPSPGVALDGRGRVPGGAGPGGPDGSVRVRQVRSGRAGGDRLRRAPRGEPSAPCDRPNPTRPRADRGRRDRIGVHRHPARGGPLLPHERRGGRAPRRGRAASPRGAVCRGRGGQPHRASRHSRPHGPRGPERARRPDRRRSGRHRPFPWLTARTIRIGGIETRALRVSYAGELGWELHVAMTESPGPARGAVRSRRAGGSQSLRRLRQ